MASRADDAIAFRRLSDVDPQDIIELMTDPLVRRHLPLARDGSGEPECARFVAAKERIWEQTGYGPWAFVLDGEFVGWGGLQPEGDDIDVGMILHPNHWGAGRALYERITDYAFAKLGLKSVIALLPPSRTRVAAMQRLGFVRDGDAVLGGERFLRYRLTAPGAAEPDADLAPSDESVLEEQISYYRARAPEYDDWFSRKGRYDRGDEHSARWASEVATVKEVFHALSIRGRVLELACGTGLWTAELAKHDVDITAVDSSPETLALNRRRVGDPAVEYIEADLFTWQPTRRFDYIIFTFWLSHVPPSRFESFWAMVRDCLAPGGRVFFLDNRWYPEYRWPHVEVNADEPPDALPWIATRELKDGRRFDIVKVFYEPNELAARLSALGWVPEIAETPSFFLYGSAARQPESPV